MFGKLNWKKYKLPAVSLIDEIIFKYHLDKQFEFNRISIRNQKTRWGSCSSKNNLNFNFRIVFLPKHLAEYLVIHEFCHLKEMNHSKDFWKLVKTFDPMYKRHQKEIRKYIVFKNRVRPIKLP